MQSGAPLKFVCMIEKFAESSLAETALRSGRVMYICLIGHLFGKRELSAAGAVAVCVRAPQTPNAAQCAAAEADALC